MEIRYQLTSSDLLAACAHVQERVRGARRGLWRRLTRWSSGRDLPWLRIEGDYALALTPAGISLHAPGGEVGFYVWPEVAALETAGDFLYFHLRRDAAVAVPRAAAADDTAHEAARLWAGHPENAGRTLPAAPAAQESPLRQTLANLLTGARVAFFMRFDPRSFRVSLGALAWMQLADFLMAAAFDHARAGPAPVFNWGGMGLYAVNTLLFFGWAAVVVRLAGQGATLLRLLVVAGWSSLLAGASTLPLYLLLERRTSDDVAVLLSALLVCMNLLWEAAVLTRVVRRLYGRDIYSALLLGGAYVLCSATFYFMAPEEKFYINPERAASAPAAQYAGAEDEGDDADEDGQDDDPGDDGQDDGDDQEVAAQDDRDEFGGGAPGDAAYRKAADQLDVESVFYRQPELVGRALATLQPRRNGEPALYFVGFAGEAEEREFGNEVRYARGLLDRRFNTAGHSIALINSLDTVNDAPLANPHNLEAVLQGLAARMDKEHDVLFMFLSSHGAQDHRLSVSFWPLQLNDLKAETLKAMLDKSGIRNRVIVVSACYSGGFLDVLKDDNSLILTASTRDHVAYGCGNITEYTYFGEAYFVKALQHSDSFIDAFDEARRLIAAREKSEGAEPSGPQIREGRNIGKVLERLKVGPAGQAYACRGPACA